MTKRVGHLMERVVDYSNIMDSLYYVLRGKRKYKSPTARYIWQHQDEMARIIQWQLWLGLFQPTKYREYEINEYGKIRKIQCIPLYDRIVLNAVMKVVETVLKPRLILNTAASIEGRGAHWLLNRLISDIKHTNEDFVVKKDDISKFYESIPQDLAKKVVRHYIKDRRIVQILDHCIEMLPNGISIGLRSSQFIALLVLNYILDHKITDRTGISTYYRYCDDSVTLTSNTYSATMFSKIAHQAIEDNGMKIKPNEQVWRFSKSPIDFLGYVIYPNDNIRIRKHIKQRFARRWKRVRSKKRKQELLASFYGICRHAKAKHLFWKITKIKMHNFADFGLAYEAADGKKRFDVPVVSLNNVMNTEIIIKDFETDIKTREGDGRYLILFTDQDGKDYKFFTNSGEMKQMLDKIRKIQDGFPFKTTIKRVSFGSGKAKFQFT